MKSRPLTIALILVIALLFISFTLVKAFPPIPSSFWGTVKVNGENIPEGTIVSAWIDGVQYATCLSGIWEGNSAYSLDVPGDDPSTDPIEGGVLDDTIVFKIGDNAATQTGNWVSSSNTVRLDLTFTVEEGYFYYLPLIVN